MLNNHPPVIVYDEDKKLYYECLQRYDESEDIKPFYEFLIYQTEKTWKKMVELNDGNGIKRKGLKDIEEGIV